MSDAEIRRSAVAFSQAVLGQPDLQSEAGASADREARALSRLERGVSRLTRSVSHFLFSRISAARKSNRPPPSFSLVR